MGYPLSTYDYVVDSYYLEDSAIYREDELGICITNEEINNENSFSVLDFRNTWQITEDGISLQCTNKKQIGVTGYVVQKYDSKNKKWKTYKTITSNTNSVTVSKLTQSTVYKFRIRSYKTINKKKYYGAYSPTFTTPTIPSKVKVKSSTIYQHHASMKYSVKWNKVKNASGYQIQVYGYDYNKNKEYWKTIKTVNGAGKTSYTSKWYNDDFDGEKIRIRAYKDVNGKKYYGAWATPKSKYK